MTNEELIELITEIVERHHCDSWTSGRACAEEIVAMLPAFDRKFQPKEGVQPMSDNREVTEAVWQELLRVSPHSPEGYPIVTWRDFEAAMLRAQSPATVALQEGQVCGQDIAPAGWWCSRAAGHDGPCAAHEKTEANPLLIAEGALRTARFAVLRQCDTLKAENEITTALWHIRAALSAPKEGTHA